MVPDNIDVLELAENPAVVVIGVVQVKHQNVSIKEAVTALRFGVGAQV
jgi:hypothetical protein